MKILYFAWLRERIGSSQESETPPSDVTTVAGLLDWLAGLSPDHAKALENRQVVRVAVNLEFAELDAPVAAGDEIALFPPMTGG
jgi:molybdopterin converting factor subunit 1